MTSIRRMVASLLLAIFVLSAPAAQAGPFLKWRRDYSAARKEARRQNRLMVLDISTQNCVWCRKLETTTFQDEKVIGLLKKDFIPMQVDAEQERSIVQELNIQCFPTVIFATPEGKIVDIVEGYVDADTFTDHLKNALKQTQEEGKQ